MLKRTWKTVTLASLPDAIKNSKVYADDDWDCNSLHMTDDGLYVRICFDTVTHLWKKGKHTEKGYDADEWFLFKEELTVGSFEKGKPGAKGPLPVRRLAATAIGQLLDVNVTAGALKPPFWLWGEDLAAGLVGPFKNTEKAIAHFQLQAKRGDAACFNGTSKILTDVQAQQTAEWNSRWTPEMDLASEAVQVAYGKEKAEAAKEKAGKSTLSEQLSNIFHQFLGSEWRKEITLTHRADDLYWLLNLAEEGLKSRELAFRKEGMTAEAGASLGSWEIDLEKIVTKVRAVLSRP